jgi:hypothetical protein
LLHIQIFQIQTALGQEGREIVEEQGERDDLAIGLADDGFAGRA